MLEVIKGMLSTALKDNSSLKFAVITGCLKIAKESISLEQITLYQIRFHPQDTMNIMDYTTGCR